MQTEAHPPKPEDLNEEDLVDYEEEEDETTTADKATENGKDGSKKYAIHFTPLPLIPSLLWFTHNGTSG